MTNSGASKTGGHAVDPKRWLDRVGSAIRGAHYSNFNEQEIIGKYLDSLGIGRESTVVDIGAGNGVRSSNTYALVRQNRRVIGIEYDSRKAAQLARAYKSFPNASACRAKVTPASVVDLLRGFSVEHDFALLSLDIDGYDYWILDAVLSAFRPKLIVSEYNEKIPPPVKFVVNYTPDFTLRHHFFGYSVAKLAELLDKHNYVLLEIEFNNVFLAPAELAAGTATDLEAAYRAGYRDRPDRCDKFKANENMDALHHLSPEKCVEFLNDFYASFAGEYEISPR